MANKDNTLRDAMQLRADLQSHIESLEGMISEARRRLKIVNDYIAVASQPQTHAGDFTPTQASLPLDTEPEQVPTRRRRSPIPPAEIAKVARQILLERGGPMTRGELVREFEARGIELAAADRAKNLGTILWRHRDIFENLPGEGYWVKGEPRA